MLRGRNNMDFTKQLRINYMDMEITSKDQGPVYFYIFIQALTKPLRSIPSFPQQFIEIKIIKKKVGGEKKKRVGQVCA